MLNSKINYITIFLFLFSSFLIAEEKPKDTIKWSAYQGKKTWQEAKESCENIKMRLPSITEINKANEMGITKEWIKNSTRYWSINKNTEINDLSYRVYNLFPNDGYEEAHKPESRLGVFCVNITEESINSDYYRNINEKFPKVFYTKRRIKFKMHFKEDGKPIYISERILPNQIVSWYFARDYGVKLNKEENCNSCYRLPLIEEVQNLTTEDKKESIWLQSWGSAPKGIIFGNVLLIIPWFGYTFDYLHDIITHPLTWQSYIYFISPEITERNYSGKWEDYEPFLMRSSYRNSVYYFPSDEDGNKGFRLVKLITGITENEIQLLK